MVEVSHLSKNYGSHPAIRDLTFSVADGQVYGLLGPNGAGKSTIMNILTSYLAPTGGDVKVAGFSLPEQAQQAKACVGYLPEQPPLYPEMTVQEYLDFAALLGSPQLIILDEPTGGLDPAQVIGIRKLIRELGKTHTVILSSHILSEVQAVCSRVLILSKGALVAEGTPEQLSEKLSPGIRLRVTALGSSDTVLPVVEAVPGITGVQLVSEADGEVPFTAETADTTDRRAEVSRALSEAGCTVLELTAENRSLEEVFLALTGETADVPEEPETDPKGE